MLHARLLQYLDEVARCGSIRRAADRLHVVPSAISRQILAYEDELGTPIFQRTPRRLMLTAAGEIIIRHVRSTLKEMARAQDQIEELKGLRRGEITVAMMSGLAANLVPHAAALFQQRNPRVKLTLRVLPTGDEILAALEAGDAELGIGFDFPDQPSLQQLEVVTGRLGAVMAPDHALAGRASLRISDCLEERLVVADRSMAIRPHLDRLFAQARIQPMFAVETNSIEVMRHAVMTGQGVTFLTPFDIDFELRTGRLAYVPVQELAHHEQCLMLVGVADKPGALASVFAESLRSVIRSARQLPA